MPSSTFKAFSCKMYTAINMNVSRASTSKPLVDLLIDELTITNDPTRTHAGRIWNLHVVAECWRCPRNPWEECKKKGQCSRLGVSIERWCICMPKSYVRSQLFKVRRCSFRGGVQSNMFQCTFFLHICFYQTMVLTMFISMFKVWGVYWEVVHLYAKIECTSTGCSKYEGVHSEEVLDLIGFTATSFYTHVSIIPWFLQSLLFNFSVHSPFHTYWTRRFKLP